MTKLEAKEWLYRHTLIGVKPIRSKYVMVEAFKTANAREQVLDHFAEKMCEELDFKDQ